MKNENEMQKAFNKKKKRNLHKLTKLNQFEEEELRKTNKNSYEGIYVYIYIRQN